jgi:hypothetical protein
MDGFMPPVGQFASETPPSVRVKLTQRASGRPAQTERESTCDADCVGSPKWTTITERYFTIVKLSFTGLERRPEAFVAVMMSV